MKALGTLLVTLTIFGSSFAMANHRINRICVSPVEKNSQTFISAEAIIDEDTGLTSALLISTTYTELQFCKAALNKKLDSPVQPQVLGDVSQILKCYKNVTNNLSYYLVSESVNLDTGLVSKLEVKNQFDNLEACQSWLE